MLSLLLWHDPSKSFGYLVLDRLGLFLRFPFFTVTYEVPVLCVFGYSAFFCR